jgi:glutamine synthetase
MASQRDVFKTIKENEVKFVDLRFTDTKGKEQHVSVPVKAFGEDKFKDGHAFDGSSIAGWKGIEASDMLLMPDPDSARMDPFYDEPTLVLSCDVLEPSTGKGYERDPRTIAKKCEAYLKSSGLGDTAYFGPEPEFFIFDAVEWKVDMSGSYVKITRGSAVVVGCEDRGRQPRASSPVKGGYFPVPPVDSLQDIRSAMCLALEEQGVEVEVHHHEVAAPGQCEIGTKFNTLVKRADWLQILKYTVHNVARSYGKTATFMPKPVVGDNGSGMHVHQSVWKGRTEPLRGRRLRRAFGVRALLHRRHHQAREGAQRDHQPGHELVQAPGSRDSKRRSTSPIRTQPLRLVPHPVRREPERRARGRCASRTRPANPYLAFAAMLMAGLDGVQNKIHPASRWTRTSTTSSPRRRRRCRTRARRSTRRSRTSTRTASSSRAAASSPTTCSMRTSRSSTRRCSASA